MSQGRVSQILLTTLESTAKTWVPKAHYPSSAGFQYKDGTVIGPDILSSFLKWTGVKPSNPPDGNAIMKMRLGDGTHSAIAGILAKSGVKVMSETSFKVNDPLLTFPVSGRTDHLMELDSDLEVIEVKSSQDSQMFGNRNFGGIIASGPKEDHLLQVICYLNCVPGVKRARIIYIARDTGRMLEFIVEKSGDTYAVDGKPVPELSWAGIVARWGRLEQIVKAGIAPAPDYHAWLNDSGEVMAVKQIKGEKHKTPWRVMYDDYRDLIWKDPKNYQYTYNAMGAPNAPVH